jgi:hypothetical protein
MRYAIAAIALIAGCAGGNPEDVICGAYCDFYYDCGRIPNNCETNCIDNNPTFRRFSDSLADALSECIPEQSCSSIDGDSLSACVDPKLEPTERTRSFCAGHTRALFECGYSPSTEECELSYAVWGESVLLDIESCDQSSSCEEREVCMRAFVESL